MLVEAILNTDNFKMLKREREKDSFPKALLLIGKDKLFLHAFAKTVSMLVLDGNACLDCDNCKKILVDSHPDVKTYPLKDKLLVSDSESIVEESFIKPIYADKKIFIIHDIDNSMESAQNKLLKVVEEPSNNVYIILTCTNINMVLPTIRSRCNKIDIGRLEEQEIVKLLPKLNQEQLDLILEVADGQVGKAEELSKMKNFVQLSQDCLSVFTEMKSSKDVLSFSKKILAYKDQTPLILEVMAIIVEDLLKIKSGNPQLVRLKPFVQDLENTNGSYTIRALCEIAKLLDKVAKEKQFNINITLAIENLLLNILEVKYICR